MPDADGEIPTSDPRNLLRRGTGSGYAEVDFVGIDGRRYRARWEANRAREKANGKLQHSRQSLYDPDSEQLLGSGKNEYKHLVEARLGLNFEQFTRAVMLAQSEFGAFLKADDKERSELLEKLTNTAIYTRLGQRAFTKAKETGERHNDLQKQAEHLLPMDTEARAALDQQLEQASNSSRPTRRASGNCSNNAPGFRSSASYRPSTPRFNRRCTRPSNSGSNWPSSAWTCSVWNASRRSAISSIASKC